MASKIVFVLTILYFEEILGHGMLLEPPNRSSLYRFYRKARPNYAENQLFCGGFWTQWGENGGNCGVCGDNYVDPRPRANENTGTYGQGRVVRTYTSGSVIQTGVVLTANHLGSFHYSLCVLDDPNAPESGEECFQPLKLADGSKQYNVSKPDKAVTNQVQLPDGLTCERCVLRWHYRTGNGWGFCEDGTGAIGCGPQETFRSCADIAIL